MTKTLLCEKTYWLFWAKTSRIDNTIHPLIYHLIDVAAVAQALWDEVLTDSFRKGLCQRIKMNEESCGTLLSFWASLHDFGKATPAFQRRYRPWIDKLRSKGFSFPLALAAEKCPHGTLSTCILETMLEDQLGYDRSLAVRVAMAVGGHHGDWPLPGEIDDVKMSHLGGKVWEDARTDMLGDLVALFHPKDINLQDYVDTRWNTVCTLLSGLTSVADWIGSMEEYFPYHDNPIDLDEYASLSYACALNTLGSLGWIGWSPPLEASSFEALFGFPPRDAQKEVIQFAWQNETPALVIIEAPTGVGKTEAALYLADRWAHALQQRGLYIAMPTQATSNQMFGRVRDFLSRRYPDSLVNLHLLHGQAQWSDDMNALRIHVTEDITGGTVAAWSWFLPKKRGLLAPFAVGTVDQALLSILQTRHFFVRLFGLSHKTVIFDEVHAYDTYMTALFERMIHWLRALGASVVILSATLPSLTRRRLIEAYVESPFELTEHAPYPALWYASESGAGVLPLEPPPSRTIHVEWVQRDPLLLSERISKTLCDGGCVAIICNTVARAQEVYTALQRVGAVPAEQLTLFHGRFPFAWRKDIEKRVLDHFGKGATHRPDKAIVVATQVIEQSLDLDFDFMVTDLAPVDLVLQRAGRLHRHVRPVRPSSFSHPRLWITAPAMNETLPDFESDQYVYEPHVLLRSFLALRHRQTITLPEDTTPLIEAVYNNALDTTGLSPEVVAMLSQTRQRLERGKDADTLQARRRLIKRPDADDLFTHHHLALEEDSPELHHTLQALTRLAQFSVSIVCLHLYDGVLYVEPDGQGMKIDLGQSPSHDETQVLAQHTVSITRKEVVRYFLDQPVPPAWRKHPLLRDHRRAIFVAGRCRLNGIGVTLRLNRELGLEIIKEEA